MIKFNQVVRVTMLAGAVAGGVLFAGQAFAFDQADYTNAVAAQQQAAADWQAAYSDAQQAQAYVDGLTPAYQSAQDGCDASLQYGGLVSDWEDCRYAAQTYYEAEIANAQAAATDAWTREGQQKVALAAAGDWASYVGSLQDVAAQ